MIRRDAARVTDDGAPKRVGIWIRVSTEDQAKGESPEHHEKRARMYAESRGWEVVCVYHLEAVSGKSVMGHPETGKMLADIQAKRVTAIIFSKLARLARNTRELLEFADIFQRESADLVSLQESIDTSTPAGRFFYTLIAGMAQWEREEIADRVAASVPIRAKLGKSLGGAAPFGYRWDGKQLVPDPAEAPVRRQLYDLFLEHRRKKTVARKLNEAGFRTRNGSPFTDTTVDRLLRDPTAKGQRRANYTKSTGDKKRWVLKPADQWVWIAVAPIVPVEIWDQANALLEERRVTGRRPAKKTVHLFSGKVFCLCGGKMAVPSNSPKYICPLCRNKIPELDLEQVFQEQLRDFFFSEDDLSTYLQQADSVLEEKRDLLTALEGEQGKIATEREKLYRLYLADMLSPASFGERDKPLEVRYLQIADERPRLQGEIDYLQIQHASSAEIIAQAQDLYGRWPDLPFEEKRRIVETIVERVVVGNGEISFDLSYLPGASGVPKIEPQPPAAKREPSSAKSSCSSASAEVMADGQRNLTGS